MNTATDDLPHVTARLPGPHSRAFVDILAQHECPAVTARRERRAVALGAADDDPIVWAQAQGALVTDADGNRLVDMTAGFAVALLGHRHDAVVSALHAQADRLLHAMGDAFPDTTRIELLQDLARLAPTGADGPLEVAMLGLSGSDAVDLAVRTAILATGRSEVVVFDGAYHGLALGVLGLQAYKTAFAAPFTAIVHPHVHVARFGGDLADLRAFLATGRVGLVLVEPLQGRGGMRVPPEGWLADVADLTRASGALFAVDEIQSGLGRTGRLWESTAQGVVPDLLCTGKALGGGLPLSACLGPRRWMDAWGASTGEAIATQTFLGHPPGCATARAVLHVIETEAVPAQVERVGAGLRAHLEAAGFSVRGRGLMLGVELGTRSLAASRALFQRGWIALPAGLSGEVLALTPPVCLSQRQTEAFTETLVQVCA